MLVSLGPSHPLRWHNREEPPLRDVPRAPANVLQPFGCRSSVRGMDATEQQLQAVLELLAALPEDAVAGIYLHGSAVLGGLQPDSDLDLLVVASRTLKHRERVALVEGLLDVSGRRARRVAGRPVELTVVVADAVRRWSYPPREDFQYGEWLRDAYEAGVVPTPRLNPDLAILIPTVLSHGAVLQGPPPNTVLAPVPLQDLSRAVAAGLPELLDELHDDARNVLLTLARAWMTLTIGVVTSKDAAATWALARLPSKHRPLLSLARRAYLGQAEDAWEEQRDQLDALGNFMSQQIATSALRGL